MDPRGLRARKRIPKSCKRCHRRKKRCVGFPTCSNCEEANLPCTRSESVLSWHHAMSKVALGHRIETLEDRLSLISSRTLAMTGGQPEMSPASTTDHGARRSPVLHNCQAGEEHDSLVQQEHSDGEQLYLGASSVFTIAEHFDRIISDASFCAKTLPIAVDKQQQLEPAHRTVVDQDNPSPDDATGKLLLGAYFEHLHLRLPFLDRIEIADLHARRHLPDNQNDRRFETVKLSMIYAVGAAILQSKRSSQSIEPMLVPSLESQLEAMAQEAPTLERIEANMLLVVCRLRSVMDTSVWFKIGLAMRICIDVGLHRETSYQKLRPCQAELRRRLFWSVYLLERYVASCLGRPFSIAEGDIDAGLPADVDDSIRDDDLIRQALESHLRPGERGQTSNISSFIVSIRLRRIASQIQSRIYRVDKDLTLLQPEVHHILNSLEEFKRTLPSLSPVENEWVEMHWNNSVRALVQPFLTMIDPADRLLGICMHAAGRMCQLFKKMRQDDSTGYGCLLVNSVFMSGLTICYCLLRSPKLWTAKVANDLRACSSALFIVAERNATLKRYCDYYDKVVNRIMEIVNEQPEGSSMSRAANNPRTDQIFESVAAPHPLAGQQQLFSNTAQGYQPQTPIISLLEQFPSMGRGSSDENSQVLLSDPFGLAQPECYVETSQPPDGIFSEHYWTEDAYNLPITYELLKFQTETT